MLRSVFIGCLAALFIGSLTSCNDELVLTSEPKDIPIVSALLSASDTAHYVRLERAFLDPTTSALEVAQNPDSIYYPDATVILRKLSTSEEFTLIEVDANLEGYQREAGIFANSPNLMYKVHSSDISMDPLDQFELIILRNENLDPVTATTEIIEPVSIQRPQDGQSLALVPGRDFKFLWLDGTNGSMFNLYMHIYVSEFPAVGGPKENRQLTWEVVRNLRTNEHEIDGVSFFSFLGGQLNADNSTRNIDSIHIEVASGGAELLELLTILQANQGVTGSDELPTYTNLSEGLGIFSSINRTISTDHMLTSAARDSLLVNAFTRDLGF